MTQPPTAESSPVPVAPANSSTAQPRFNLDTWAVFVALGLALLIRLGVLKSIPW